MSQWNGRSLLPSQRRVCHLTSDASGTWGCGAFVEKHWFLASVACCYATPTHCSKRTSASRAGSSHMGSHLAWPQSSL